MLKLEHIQKSFDGVHILNDLSLEIPNGEIVSILGPSGSGKTTLLNLILGITEIDEGRILFNEQDMTHVPMEQRGFNIVFQDYALFPNLTAFENITYGLKKQTTNFITRRSSGTCSFIRIRKTFRETY